MKIYDTHAHLDHIDNIETAITNAEEAGVKGIVAVSVNADSCLKNLEIKTKYPKANIHLAFGMHPSDQEEAKVEEIKNLCREHRDQLTAIGEIGLDFWYKWVRKDKEKKDEQRRIFRSFLELALELDLPAIIHTRGTWREAFETTKEIGLKKAEFHWYSGPLDVLDDIISEGYYVSTSPSVAYSPQSREAMAHAPIEQTMIETDSPVYFKARDEEEGFKAEPKDVLKTLKAYSNLKQLDQEEALKILNDNAEKFFNL